MRLACAPLPTLADWPCCLHPSACFLLWLALPKEPASNCSLKEEGIKQQDGQGTLLGVKK